MIKTYGVDFQGSEILMIINAENAREARRVFNKQIKITEVRD